MLPVKFGFSGASDVELEPDDEDEDDPELELAPELESRVRALAERGAAPFVNG